VTLTLTGTSQLMAAQYSAATELGVAVDHDSNRTLLPDGPASALGSTTGHVQLARTTETASASLDGRFTIQRHDNRDIADANAWNVAMAISQRGERYRADLTGSWASDSALQAERLSSGLPGLDSTREQKQAGVTLAWNGSQRMRTTASISWLETQFRDANSRVISGYRYPSLMLGQTWGASERTALTVQGSVAQIDYGSRVPETRSTSASLALQHTLSTLVSGSMLVGYSQQERAGRSSGAYVASIQLKATPSERMQIDASYQRRIAPSSDGQLLGRDEASFRIDQNVTSRLAVYCAVDAVRNRQLPLDVAVTDRYEFLTIESGAAWRFRERWTVRARIFAAESQATLRSGTERSYGGGFGLYWTPQPRLASR
jgi:hypothetical protein